MLSKINKRVLMMYLCLQNALGRIREEESGMEVMQIVLLLGAGIGVVALLIGFGGQITDKIGELVQNLLGGL